MQRPTRTETSSTDVFDPMLETLAVMVERDVSADLIDSTVVRAHHCAVGIKNVLRKQRLLAYREEASVPNVPPDAMLQLAHSGLCRHLGKGKTFSPRAA